MSFSDMMSSGRGPGVIGMVMALIVLVGFGLLFMFAFDEGLQGGVSLESEIKAQTREMDDLRGRTTRGTATLGLAPSRNSSAKELRQMNVELKTRGNRITELKSEIEAINTEILKRNQDWATYKDQYREVVRSKAKGQVMETLATRNGEVFKNVNIREVTAVGIQIRHDEGQKRIPFEELSDEIQDFYQFDPTQKHQAVAAEAAERDKHEAAVAVVSEQVDAQMAAQRAKDAAAAKEKLNSEIIEKQAQIESIKAEIEGLEQEIVQANAAASAAREAGRMHINKSGSINGKIRHRQGRISTLQAEIRQMQSRL